MTSDCPVDRQVLRRPPFGWPEGLIEMFHRIRSARSSQFGEACLRQTLQSKSVRRCYADPMDEAIDAYNRSLDWLGVGGHPRNDARAFQLNERAVALGDPDAILAKGWFHLNGRGVERDLSLAELWYRRSAWRGEPRAMFSLGQMSYDAGDYTHARRWFERATKHGHVRSYYWLGKLAWRFALCGI